MDRHALEPVAGTTIADVTHRVLTLRGWPFDLADLTVSVRLTQPARGALEQALETGDVVRSYALRGGSCVFTPEDAAVVLSTRTATRIWETDRWQRQGNFELDDWQPLRDAVREALAAGPMTREEIGAHLARIPGLRHLVAGAAGAGADSLYKPLHWWGDICFGRPRDGESTFRLLCDDPRWPGLPDVDTAGPRALALYLGAYGPATLGNLRYFFTEGLGVPARRLSSWLADLGDDVTAVLVDGVRSYARTADLDRLGAAEPSEAVRLVPAFDPWIMGPGTADARVLSPARRALASRGANLVLSGGVTCGIWRVHRRSVTLSWFEECGSAPVSALGDEVQRLAEIRGQELALEIVHLT